MSDLGNRHRGDLGGKLNPGGDPVRVAVVVEDPVSVADQHTTWMLLTLLARLGRDVVDTILVHAPDGPLHPRVCPLASTPEFPEALLTAVQYVDGAADVIRSSDLAGADLTLQVGPGPAPARGWRVAGDGWQGTLTTREVPGAVTGSELPLGPYAAACLAAAEVFRHVRIPEDRRVSTEHACFDLWDRTDVPPHAALSGLAVDFGLAGVGAVGSAALHALWATAGLCGRAVIADNDSEGIDATNLNRCVLFDSRHLGAPKASTAREICDASELEIIAIDGSYAAEHLPEPRPRMLLSRSTRTSPGMRCRPTCCPPGRSRLARMSCAPSCSRLALPGKGRALRAGTPCCTASRTTCTATTSAP